MDYSTKATLLGGTPLAVATVWVVEHIALQPGQHLDSTVAVAFGSIGATVFGELWKVLSALLERWVRMDDEQS